MITSRVCWETTLTESQSETMKCSTGRYCTYLLLTSLTYSTFIWHRWKTSAVISLSGHHQNKRLLLNGRSSTYGITATFVKGLRKGLSKGLQAPLQLFQLSATRTLRIWKILTCKHSPLTEFSSPTAGWCCRKEMLIAVLHLQERTGSLCCNAMLWSWSFWKQDERGFENTWLWKMSSLLKRWGLSFNCFHRFQVWKVTFYSSNIPWWLHRDGSPLAPGGVLVLWASWPSSAEVRERNRLHAVVIHILFLNVEIVECILQTIT